MGHAKIRYRAEYHGTEDRLIMVPLFYAASNDLAVSIALESCPEGFRLIRVRACERVRRGVYRPISTVIDHDKQN